MCSSAGKPPREALAGRVARRVFPRFADPDSNPQRLVGIIGGGGTILVGIVNSFIISFTEGNGLLAGLISAYTGLILGLGLISIACGFWDHPAARWTHIAIFVFSGIFGALTANRGNITSAFFIVFAMVLLVEYRFNRTMSWIMGIAMLGGYLAALSVGYSDDAPRPMVSAFASLITVMTFVGLFGGVTLRHRLALQRHADELERRVRERTADLDMALRERTVMLQEIHHRVKNNMQTVSTLLGMEAERKPGPDAERALNSSRQRIHAMAGVHDVLYQSERLDQVDLAGYVKKLVDTLLQTAIIPVEVEVDVSLAANVDLSLASSLGLVLNELVNNAIKHGFTKKQTARLEIRMRRADHSIQLSVKDNGSGLPKGFDIERSAGVGMGVVISIVRHRGGSISHETNGGTRWSLEIPITAETGEEGLS